MKKVLRPIRLITALLLTAALFAGVCTPAYAAGNAVYDKYALAYFTSTNSRSVIQLYYTDDSTYMAADDLATAAKMDVEGAEVTKVTTSSGTKTKDTITYTRKDSVFSYTMKVKNCLVLQNKWYVPLQETAKALHVRYMYDEANQTLIFHHTEKLEEDLIDYAKYILGENKRSNGVQRYYLADFANSFETAVASAFNVLVEKGIFDGIASLAMGTYGKEKYEKAIAAILASDGSKSISAQLEDLLKDGKDGLGLYVDIVSSADALTVAFENDLEAEGINLFEQFGEFALTFGFRMSDTDQILKVYNDLSIFGPSDFMALYHRMTQKEQSELLYIRAFNYGLGENEYIDERELSAAVKDVYPFTKDGADQSDAAISWAFKKVAENLAGKAAKAVTKEAKKAIMESFSSGVLSETQITLDSIVSKIISKLYSKVSKTKKRTEAVEQSYLLSQIQYYAAANMRAHSYPGTRDYDPVAVKYALILYLRAAQVGFESFEFEKDLAPYIKQAEESLTDLLLGAASWQDEQMNVPDEAYPRLDFTKDGFFDSVGNADLSDGVHRLIFHKSQLSGNVKDGYSATVYELNYVTYKDSVIKALRVGDRIGGVTINKMDWYGDSYLVINYSELYLVKLDDGLWYQTLENDILVTIEGDPFTLKIPSDVQFSLYLQSPWDEETAKDLETLLSYSHDDKVELEVWVENQKITRIVRQYKP